MSRINIEEIRQQLLEDKWELISETYTNLDTNLEYKCAAGHTVVAPWKRIRERRICPTCMRETLKTKEFKNRKKKQGEYRILALDQATYTSGYSVFSNKNLVDYGFYESSGNNDIERCAHVKEWMESLIHTYEIDFVGFEGIQYQSSVGVTTFETLARLQGILMECCYELGVSYGVVNTNTWRENCGVKGRTRTDKKRSAQILVKQWYQVEATEDECDAILIGKYYNDSQRPKVEVVDWEE